MLEILLLIFISIIVVILGVLFYRSLTRLTFSQSLDSVLEREIYSSDPVIRDLVEQMQELQWFMIQLQDNYRFNSLGENTEDETA